MLINKIAGQSKIQQRYGELLKESQSGIKVFKKIKDDGTVILSSFDKDNMPFRTITKRPHGILSLGRKKIISTNSGHETVAENHRTGITTIIERIQKTFETDSVYEFDTFMNRKMYKGDVLKSSFIRKMKGSHFIGKSSYRVEAPRMTYSRDLKFDDTGNLVSSEINIFELLA